MNKILNNILKCLLITLVVVITGGILSMNMKVSPNTSLRLVSSSLISSIKTDEVLDQVSEEIEDVESNLEEIEEIKTKEENPEAKKETPVIEEKDQEKVLEKTEEKKQEKVEEKIEENHQEVVITPPKEEIKEEVIEQKEVIKNEVPSPNGSYSPNLDAASGVLETYHGVITAYGPDCYGCTSGATASGYNVLNGNIYYNDKTYGTIRIVAGDRSLPFGTIVKISGLNISTEPVLAIVLDRGGDIGFNKSIYFDLLFTSERSSDVYNFGKQTATFEILRRGY